MPLLSFIRKHFVVIVLLAVIVFLFINRRPGITPYKLPAVETNIDVATPNANIPALGGISSPSFSLKQDISPSTSDRIVVKNSNLSLVVKDVRQAGDQIINYAKSAGGFMVSASYNRPSESPFATITIRVPVDKFDEALKYFRSLGIKVTSENLVGTDVTEEYTDLDARIATLGITKSKFEEILDTATQTQDILSVQREIINLQVQIDNLKGQKRALEQDAQLTKITVFLSTDELSLPYTPDKTFRPNVIFKQAVRSMFGTLRVAGEAVIWVAVFSVIWLPVMVLIFAIAKWQNKRKLPQNKT